MEVKLKKSEVARIAQVLTTTKINNPDELTPMAIAAKNETKQEREKFLRVARYLGWNVAKRGGYVYENGRQIWSTDGD